MNYLEQVSKVEREVIVGLDSINYDELSNGVDKYLCNVITLLREASDYINQILELQSIQER